ncbi:MAG TPA: hypothetical protein VFX16_28010 [Pseudonocardiaceae bacterium]|nr:hypothetical protein [Pseudonocardiaceae bacterium]
MRRFNDPDDRNRPPEDLTAWLAAGLRRVDALAWRRWNFTLADAKQWRAAGVSEALTAAQWQIAGADPTTVGNWINARITVGEAIRWHEFGFKFEQARDHTKAGRSPDEAYGERHPTTTPQARQLGSAMSGWQASSRIRAFLKAGVPHDVMGGYLQTQWTDDEAIAWSRQGIQAQDARLWQMIGLTPVEAGELEKVKQTAATVVRDWWRAGIPFDEVGDWIGAGLTPDEAVAQREAGVTVEQAAALRALRRGGAV